MPKAINRDHFVHVSPTAWRVLTAVEMGMKNHSIVPIELVHRIAHVNQGGSGFLSIIKDQLVPSGLLAYEVEQRHHIRGYRLTNRGYDYLALHQLAKSNCVYDLGAMIGTGKESDVYLAIAIELPEDLTCSNDDADIDEEDNAPYVVIKFHRLGRTSFRKVKEKREYHQHRQSCSWLYLDRLSAKREFEAMQALYNAGFPVPRPLANNRNAVVMEYLKNASTLCEVPSALLRASGAVLARHLYLQASKLVKKCASVGFIHGDFNEFNLMVENVPDLDPDSGEVDLEQIPKSRIILIDFPQMINVEGIIAFFGKFFDLSEYSSPVELESIKRKAFLDVDIKLPGYIKPNIRKRDELQKALDHLDLGHEDQESIENDDDNSCENSDQESSDDDSSYSGLNNKEKKSYEKSMIHNYSVKERLKKEIDVKERRSISKKIKKQVRVGQKSKFKAEVRADIDLYEL
ncbi:Serine/threonine-protein kinase RIO2 [Cichlidogyrus casuarinus]|uniref:non-specific serine/threonine protein kinase n=1 Tax=Cichlidogyrus casuarinus TaxID=1844966 RepID=A0ABD2Q240_9PLAT